MRCGDRSLGQPWRASASKPANRASRPPSTRRPSRRPMRPASIRAARYCCATCSRRTCTRQLQVPAADQRAYAERLEAALDAHTLGNLSGEYVVLVDRNANVQALFIYFRATPADSWQMIGASPVSTGRPGEYDHFITPLGVFEHTPANMDFRSEGTQNEKHIAATASATCGSSTSAGRRARAAGARAACRRCGSRCMRPIRRSSNRCSAFGIRRAACGFPRR